MSTEIRQAIDGIPIPPELRNRSRLGIEQAQEERNKTARARRGAWAAAILGVICIAALFHRPVYAAIHKVLQFIPGVGIVSEEEVPTDRYILQNPITVNVDAGTMMITGIVVEEKQTLITAAGKDVRRFDRVTLRNEQGKEFVIRSSISTGGSNVWSGSFWYNGPLEIKDRFRLIFSGQPDLVVPIQLVKAKKYDSYGEMGEVSEVNDLTITAVANQNGGKVRISLLPQPAEMFSVSDFGYLLYGQAENSILVQDDKGKSYDIEWIPGIVAPRREFTFDLDGNTARTYTVTIPQINVTYKSTAKVRLPIPEPGVPAIVNQSITIAGFPVEITKAERIGQKALRVYVDLHYRADVPKSLHYFNPVTQSYMARLSEDNGVMEYFEIDIEPDSKHVVLNLDNPQVVLRGPWTFKIEADKYWGNG
jgi:hypothetical protein